mgnify:CR=1 FL=1
MVQGGLILNALSRFTLTENNWLVLLEERAKAYSSIFLNRSL